MQKRFTLTLVLAFLVGFTAYSQSTQFQRTIGGSSNDNTYAIEPTPGGGFIMVGYTESFGAGGKDVYLTKVDGLGQVEWSRAYGSKGNETGWSVTVASDSGYVIAGTTDGYSSNGSNDGLVFKTDENGKIDWTLSLISDSAIDAYSVITGRSGEFYVTGYAKTDSMGDQLYVARINSNGTLSWHQSLGTPGNEEGYGLYQDVSGDIIFAGITDWDSITVGGKAGSPGDIDMFIGRLSSTGGTPIWTTTYGTGGEDIAWDILADQTTYVVTGWTNGGGSGDNDVSLALMDTSGVISNAFTYSTFGDDRGFSIEQLSQGVYMVGAYSNPSGADRNVLTMTVGSNGFLQNYALVGGSGTDGHWPTDIARAQDGGIVTLSTTNSFNSNTGNDWYLIRSDNKLSNACNSTFDIINASGIIFGRDSVDFNARGARSRTVSLTTTNVTSSDSTLCCKLDVRTVADSVVVCGPEGANIGRAPLSGYSYSWRADNSNWTSSDANPFVTPTENTVYTLVVSSKDNACAPDSGTVRVVVKELLKDDFARDTFFCEGESVRIATKSGLSLYSWTGKTVTDNDSIVIVSSPDTLYLRVVDNNGCSYRDTAIVEESPLPRFNLGNDTTICTNLPIALSGPDDMASYDWNSGESSAQTFSTNVEQVHKLVVVDSMGCTFSDNISIFTNPFSSFSLGPDTLFCENTTYFILGPGALSNYEWNDTSSTLQNLPITEPGTYWLKAYNSFGCPYSDTVTLGERPAPEFTLTNNLNICDGETRVLRGPSGAELYLWQDNSTADTLEVTFGGTYWLTVRDEFNCPYTDTAILVDRLNPVVALGNDTAIFWGDSVELDAGAGFTTYEWSTNETTQKIWAKDEATYSVVVTNEYGCTGGDAINIDTNLKVSVKDLFVGEISIYPVPASTYLSLDLSGLTDPNVTVEIFDMTGKLVVSEQLNAYLRSSHRIDVSNLSAGVHTLRVHNSSGTRSLRLLVE